jgi:hypothetical protein
VAGIIGTPIVDWPSGTLFFDAMTRTANGPRHLIHAVSLADGSELPGAWPVDVTAMVSGFDATHQNQHGALQLVGGWLFVPYGAWGDDCPPFYGWVVGVPLSNPAGAQGWQTVAGAPWDAGSADDAGPVYSGGGIWAPGGLATDGTYVFAASGNTMTGDGFAAPPFWVGGDSVFRLTPGPSFSGQTSDYFHPKTWQALDNGDLDLGATGPVLFDLGSSHYVTVVSKDSTIYVLDRDSLGGDDGALSMMNVGPSFLSFASPSVFATGSDAYLALLGSRADGPTLCTSGGMEVVHMTGHPPAPTSSWCSAEGIGSPPIITTSDGTSDAIVWGVGGDFSSQKLDLMGYAPDTGERIVNTSGAPDVWFLAPPIVADGRLVFSTIDADGGGSLWIAQ